MRAEKFCLFFFLKYLHKNFELRKKLKGKHSKRLIDSFLVLCKSHRLVDGDRQAFGRKFYEVTFCCDTIYSDVFEKKKTKKKLKNVCLSELHIKIETIFCL